MVTPATMCYNLSLMNLFVNEYTKFYNKYKFIIEYTDYMTRAEELVEPGVLQEFNRHLKELIEFHKEIEKIWSTVF